MTDEVKPLGDDALREIEERADAATAGPWRAMRDGNQYTDVRYGQRWTANLSSRHITGASVIPELPRAWNPWYVTDATELENVSRFKDEDADFIAHAREDIPALCQTVRALRNGTIDLQRQLNAQQCLQCGGKITDGYCSECRERDNYCEQIEAENTVLRERLAQSQTHLREQRETIKFWQRHIARMGKLLGTVAMDTEVEEGVKQLQSQLAQVTQERDRAKEDLRILTKGRFIQS